jgi:hypothetical protein
VKITGFKQAKKQSQSKPILRQAPFGPSSWRRAGQVYNGRRQFLEFLMENTEARRKN